MNYELAKKLEDAGFPKTGFCGHCGYPDDTKGPTLSELIEACGDRFCLLASPFSTTDSKKWVAIAIEKLALREEGTTPQIAVAKLWLAIHNISPQ